MCYRGKCFHCLPVEQGCLVLAIINAVISSLILLASVITDILLLVEGTKKPHQYGSTNGGDSDNIIARILAEILTEAIWYTAVFIIALVALASLVALVMSVLLCHGIYKRRPTAVLMYLTFGVVVTVLVFLASVFELCKSKDKTLGIVEVAGCVIYSLFLVLVYQTYTKLRRERDLQERHTYQESSAVAVSGNVLMHTPEKMQII